MKTTEKSVTPKTPAGKTTVAFSHAIADKVHLIEIDRPGRVDALMIDSAGPQYRVVYWNDSSRQTAWLYGYEIRRSA